jgi:hypothetical protein
MRDGLGLYKFTPLEAGIQLTRPTPLARITLHALKGRVVQAKGPYDPTCLVPGTSSSHRSPDVNTSGSLSHGVYGLI